MFQAAGKKAELTRCIRLVGEPGEKASISYWIHPTLSDIESTGVTTFRLPSDESYRCGELRVRTNSTLILPRAVKKRRNVVTAKYSTQRGAVSKRKRRPSLLSRYFNCGKQPDKM
eukprot:768527-Hanusia_phi.AAC.1